MSDRLSTSTNSKFSLFSLEVNNNNNLASSERALLGRLIILGLKLDRYGSEDINKLWIISSFVAILLVFREWKVLIF